MNTCSARPHPFLLPVGVLLLSSASLVANGRAQDVSTMNGLPLLFEDDFERGMDAWTFTDERAWEIAEDAGEHVLHLHRQSVYEPPVRSPYNLALVEHLWVSDFILEARVKSTDREYGHRDMIVFFGWQDPSRFYYVHLAPEADAHANSIFLVDGADRVSVADWRTDGTRWLDDVYHTIRVEHDVELAWIRVYFDDMETPVMTSRDDTIGYGRVGLGSFDDTGMIAEVRVWGRDVSGERATEADGSADGD